ncbi:MAG: glycoside hydrolase family 18 protein [Planctomycetes bacterium]|nr:glycoside hydrolase family 18 protein [Planctomycetota bacterium]
MNKVIARSALLVGLLLAGASAASAQMVQGYVYTSEILTAPVLKDVDRRLLTHTVVHGTYAGATGALTGFNPTSASVATFVDRNHNRGTKVLLSIINFNATTTKTLLDYNQAACVTNIVNQVRAARMDGASVDFENISDSTSYRNKFTAFVSALSSALRAHHLELYLAVYTHAYNRYNAAALASLCDGIFLMGYDFHWSGSSVAGPIAPLTRGGYWPTAYDSVIFNRTSSLAWWKYCDQRKLIVGMPLYGRKWKTTSAALGAPAIAGTSTAHPYRTSILGNYGRIWDPKSQTPYATGTAGGTYWQLWYDDADSLGRKFDETARNDFGGIGFWKLPWADEAIWKKVEAYAAPSDIQVFDLTNWTSDTTLFPPH